MLATAPRIERLERLTAPLPETVEVDVGETPPETVLEWAARYRQLERRAFSLDGFAPLRAIYEDAHRHICVIKPSQRGVSEWAINLTMFALDRGAEAWQTGKDGLNVAYLFPTQAALGDFSKERFSGLKRETSYLQALLAGSEFDAVTFKAVRDSYLYLRGAWSEDALLSFAADMLVLDEYDRMDPQAVALARRRLGASVVRRELDISTPTLPGKGIHALYLQSDRRVYEQPCVTCGEWVTFDFFRDVRADGEPHTAWKEWAPERIRRAEVRLHCPACRAPWSADNRCAEGRWRAEAPEIESLRGYHVPWWPFPFVDLVQLAVSAVSQDPSERQEFFRSDLGLPYEGGGSRVTEAMLRQLSAELPNGLLPDVTWRATVMGVDVGSRFHYRVSSLGPDNAVYVRAMGSVGSWAGLDRLMHDYLVRQCVVDALPETHACREWAARWPGQVLRAFYPAPSALAGEPFRVKEDEGIVQINRTMALDKLYAAIATAAERWPAAITNDPEVIAHLTASVRVTRTDDRGQEKAEWIHTAPDHLAHASVYDQLAREVLPAVTPGVGTVRVVKGWTAK